MRAHSSFIETTFQLYLLTIHDTGCPWILTMTSYFHDLINSVFTRAGRLAVVVVELVAAHSGPHVPLQRPAVAPRVRHRAAVGAQPPSRAREVRTSEFSTQYLMASAASTKSKLFP